MDIWSLLDYTLLDPTSFSTEGPTPIFRTLPDLAAVFPILHTPYKH